MFVLSAKLRECRRKHEMTQEDVANALNVAPQTVSKWERGETYPDITLLPALANLFDTTTDALLGMAELRLEQELGLVYTRARKSLRRKDWNGAVRVYEEALKAWPNDAGILTDLAMALGLSGEKEELARAVELCERVLSHPAHGKVQHTARAALCYLHAMTGNAEKAMQKAGQLPHQRESREVVRERLQHQDDLMKWMYELSTGESIPE